MVQTCATKFFFWICTTLPFESYQKLQIISIPNRFKSILIGLTDLYGSSTDSPRKVRPLLQRWATSATASCCYAWNSVEVVLQHLCCSIVDGSTVEHDAMTEIWAKIPQGILMSGCDYQLMPHVFLIGAAMVWESHPASWNGLGARPVHNLCGRCNFFDQPFFNWLAQTPPKSSLLYRVFSLWRGILAARFGFVVCITMERVCSRKWVYQMLIRWHVFPSHHR